jgi:ATP-dependent Clp protease, protease subunit
MRNLPPEVEAALLGSQVVFVRGMLDDAAANTVIAQLLLLSRLAAGRPIEMYIDSPSGSVSAALSVYDMLQTLGIPVATTCVSTAGGASVLVLAGGTRGQRFALPHARVHLLDESVSMAPRPGPELERSAANVRDQSVRWRTALLKHVSVPSDDLVQSLSSPRWLSAQEAQQLGLIDAIVPRAGA